VTVRLLGAILAVVMGRVAAQFARDRAAVPAEQASNLRRRLAAHQLCGNQVSFFLGELVIRHRCNPVPGRMRRQLVSPLPTFVQDVLHLPCESARPNHAFNRTRRYGPSSWRTSSSSGRLTWSCCASPESSWKSSAAPT